MYFSMHLATYKIRRLISRGETQDKAIELSRHNGQSARCVRPAVSRAEMAGTPPIPRNV